MKKTSQLILSLICFVSPLGLAETVLGSTEIEPGIMLTFEAAARDKILPEGLFLAEEETDVHIEMLATWSDAGPSGSQPGGHVAYLEVSALIRNERTGEKFQFMLTPHLNLSDNLHYAQNIKLPGALNDSYTIDFKVGPPETGRLGVHLDWVETYGEELTPGVIISFSNLNLKEVAESKRR